MNITPRSVKKERAFFIIYMFLFAALAITVAIMQPIFDNSPLFSNPPDEHSRILIPEFIAKYGYLPTGLEEEIIIDGYGISYGLTPYLPYLIMGYLMRFAGLFTESELFFVYIGRFVNIVCGLCMAYTVYKLSNKVFLDDFYRWMFNICVVFLPQHIFIYTYINTEAMCFLGISLVLYFLVSIYKDGIDIKNAFGLSIGLTFVISTYYNAYGYVVSAFVLFLAYFVSGKENKKISYDYKKMLKYFVFIFAIVFALSGWWFIRNAILHDGDFLGMTTQNKMYLSVNPSGRPSYLNKGYSLFEMFDMNPDYFDKLWKTLIAGYGSAAMFCNNMFYLFYKIIWLVGLTISFIYGVFKIFIAKKYKKKMSFSNVFFHINMIYCICMPIVLHLYYAYAVDYQPQGRYLLPMLLPLYFYIVKGYEVLFRTLRGRFEELSKVKHFVPVIISAFVIFSAVWMIYKVAAPVYLSDPLWTQF